MTQEATSGMVEGIANFFKELVDVSMNASTPEAETLQRKVSTGAQIFETFELQFHTVETINMKNELHALYEEWRTATTSPVRKQEIQDYMLDRWRTVPVPPSGTN